MTPPTTTPTSSRPVATPSTAPSSSSTSCRSRRPAPTRRCSSTLSWLQQVNPGADPYVLRRLLVVGGPAVRREVRSRSAASSAGPTLIDALSKTDNWTANGMTRAAARRDQAHRRLLAVHPAQRRHVEAGGRHQVHLRRNDAGLRRADRELLHRLHPLRAVLRGGVRDRGQRPGADLQHDPGLQHRPRCVRACCCRSSSGTSASGRGCPPGWRWRSCCSWSRRPSAGSSRGSSRADSATRRPACRWS